MEVTEPFITEVTTICNQSDRAICNRNEFLKQKQRPSVTEVTVLFITRKGERTLTGDSDLCNHDNRSDRASCNRNYKFSQTEATELLVTEVWSHHN